MISARMKGPRWDNLLPEVRRRVLLLLERAKAEGLDVDFFSGWRSVESQLENMANGYSWVTDPLDSYHAWGMAVDIPFVGVTGFTWPDPDVPENMERWQKLGAIGKALGFTWGGDWAKKGKFDGAHFQFNVATPSSLKTAYNRDPLAFLRENGVPV